MLSIIFDVVRKKELTVRPARTLVWDVKSTSAPRSLLAARCSPVKAGWAVVFDLATGRSVDSRMR